MSREERLSTFTSKKAPAGILNVCGISPHCTEAELKKVFGMFGSIHSVYFTLNFNPRFVSSGGGYAINGGTGWGYVNYYEASAARVARSVLNEVILKGVKLSVMERHDAGFHSDEPLQFTVVVRTFDKTIVMENIEDMVKDSVPLIEISSASFKVYSRIEGASVQCATITALSLTRARLLFLELMRLQVHGEAWLRVMQGKRQLSFGHAMGIITSMTKSLVVVVSMVVTKADQFVG